MVETLQVAAVLPGDGKAGSTFFAVGAAAATADADWQRLRGRWEYSHVARAVLAAVSLVALVIAINGATR